MGHPAPTSSTQPQESLSGAYAISGKQSTPEGPNKRYLRLLAAHSNRTLALAVQIQREVEQIVAWRTMATGALLAGHVAKAHAEETDAVAREANVSRTIDSLSLALRLYRHCGLGHVKNTPADVAQLVLERLAEFGDAQTATHIAPLPEVKS